MRDAAVTQPLGRFSIDQLLDGQFKTTAVLTSKQMAGVIALRQYDMLLKERGAVIVDTSLVKAQNIPKLRADLVNALEGTVEPNYKPADTALYGIDVVSMMVTGSSLKGIFDIYATIDLAEYICKVYDSQNLIFDLHSFLPT
jgi:hypothetical protein